MTHRADPPAPAAPRAGRRRALVAAAAVVVLLTGLGVRLLLTGAWTGPTGDVLYAVLVHLGIAFLLPRRSPWTVGALALAFCTAIELFQLTGLPLAWAQAFPPARLVFGTSFVAADLALYALGVAGATAADLLAGRARRRRPGQARGTSSSST